MPSLLLVSARDKFTKILQGRLHKGGYIVCKCENCGEAFELLEWMFFHMALFDFSPSDEDPIMMELVRSHRASDQTIPIIAMPLALDDPRREELLALRVHIIDSPVSLPDLLEFASDMLKIDPYDPDRDRG
jgi:DNA-binding NtrC family response regulator